MSRKLAVILFSPWREKAGAASLSKLHFVSFAMEDSRQSKEQRLNRLALVGSAPTKLRAMAPQHMGTCGSFWVNCPQTGSWPETGFEEIGVVAAFSISMLPRTGLLDSVIEERVALNSTVRMPELEQGHTLTV
jgi:hypothetical protein